MSPRSDYYITQRNNSFAWLAWLACFLACLLAWPAWLACLPGLFGPFFALAVRGPGVPDRGEMKEEEEKENEEKKCVDLRLNLTTPL